MSGLPQHTKNHLQSGSESPLHKQAKTQIKNLIVCDNALHTVKTECPIPPGHRTDVDQIADIFVRTRRGQKIAIEIQCSLQSTAMFKRRTDTYGDHGIHVLWLIDKDTYLPSKQSRDGEIHGTACKDAVRWLQNQYFGRIYAFSQHRLETPGLAAIIPIRLQPIQRKRTGFDPATLQHFRYTRSYKTIANALTGVIPDYSLLTATTNGRRVARFYDNAWWTGGRR